MLYRSDAQDLAEPHSCQWEVEEIGNVHDLFKWSSWLHVGDILPQIRKDHGDLLMHTRVYVAVITIVGFPNDGEYRDVAV